MRCIGRGRRRSSDAGRGRCGCSRRQRRRRPERSWARGVSRPMTVTARRSCGCSARALVDRPSRKSSRRCWEPFVTVRSSSTPVACPSSDCTISSTPSAPASRRCATAGVRDLLVALVPAGAALPALLTLAVLAAVLVTLIAYEALRYPELRDRVRHQLAPEPVAEAVGAQEPGRLQRDDLVRRIAGQRGVQIRKQPTRTPATVPFGTAEPISPRPDSAPARTGRTT